MEIGDEANALSLAPDESYLIAIGQDSSSNQVSRTYKINAGTGALIAVARNNYAQEELYLSNIIGDRILLFPYTPESF